MQRGLGSFPNPRFRLIDGKEDNSFFFLDTFSDFFSSTPFRFSF